MKITEFEVGKKYCLPEWRSGLHIFIESGEGDIKYQHDSDFSNACMLFRLSLIKRNDWQEYKEPVDYGDWGNCKLMLVKRENECPVWCEGANYDDELVTLSRTDGLDGINVACHKDYILKVIDLPGKEL